MRNIKPYKQIFSVKNPRLKNLLNLQKRKNREEQGRFGVEGAREIKRALGCSFSLLEFYICPSLFSEASKDLAQNILEENTNLCFELDKKCFNKIVVRENTDGVYAIFSNKYYNLEDCIPENRTPLILVLEGIEKPGNLGALLRSADGAGASGVINLSDCCDPFNPGVIRSSLGTIFSTPLVQTNISNLQKFFHQHNIQSYAATLSDKSIDYAEVSYKKPSALFLGNEAHGLSNKSIQLCQYQIKIPMLGVSDSLNVSVAGAILLYEARRQRSLQKTNVL